jgi:iron complex transport system ATP-binding protein
MVNLEGICFSAGKQKILKNVSAHFEGARINGVIGPNGAGKSTLLKIICRVWLQSEGSVMINGVDHRKLVRKELSRVVTMVPQNTHISFPISVYDVVAMGRHPHRRRFESLNAEDRSIVNHALKTCQIFELKDRNISELSGGECQLAIIARALATEADLILLDEPTSDLDISHSLTIMDILEKLKRHGKSIIINLHDLNFAQRFCDSITILHQGRLFFRGDPSEAFSAENIKSVFGVDLFSVHHEVGTFLHFSKPEALTEHDA